MIADMLEEDLLEEFKGGTLSINPDSKAINDKAIKSEAASTDNKDTETTNKANSNNAHWSSNFISPLTSIPNKITATLFNKDGSPAKETSATKANNTLQQTICITENPNNYFTFRESVLAKALSECKEQFLDEEADGPLIEAFLLTQISHWNSDKERVILLTPKSLVVAKYDFIALKRLGYKKLPLEVIDEVIVGQLVYPNGSLIPQMNGLVDGISNVLETCLFSRWSQGESKQLTSFYQPRNRNMKGVRLVWNKNKPVGFGSQWNPFNEDVPVCTFTYHPLFFHKDCVDESVRNLYNLETFVEKICQVIADLPRRDEHPCIVQEQDIVLQSYVGIGSIIHNRNSLGFFKVRGKFSF